MIQYCWDTKRKLKDGWYLVKFMMGVAKLKNLINNTNSHFAPLI